MKQRLLLIFLLLSSKVFSQTILEIHPPTLAFDSVLTNTTDSLSFWIVNNSPAQIHINNITNFRNEFFVRDTNFIVAANDSIERTIYFFTKHNVSFRDVVLVETNDSSADDAAFTVSAVGKYSDVMYSFTQNLRDEPLKTALHNFTKNHTSLGYNTARDKMFEYIDDYNSDDTLECVYTGRKIFATNRDEAQAQNFNTEHTWPQSFFNEAEPMKSDVFHLFPTDNDANSARSNFPFGIVVANVSWQQGGSKLGKNSQNQTVFEPRAIHKGNVARSLLYFVVRYDSNYGNFLSNTQESILRLWNRQDEVNAMEKTRNYRIASFQQKRNPFIDHPEFVERISQFSGTATTQYSPEIFVSENAINFGFQIPGTFIAPRNLLIVNSGTTNLTITSFQLRTSFFSVAGNVTSVPADSFVRWKINFSPTEIGQNYFDTLSLFSNDTDEEITNIVLQGTTAPLSVREEHLVSAKFFLEHNFPNPFNPTTEFRFHISDFRSVSLTIFDIRGKEVATVVNKHLFPGTHIATWDANNFPGGIYFYRLSATDFSITKKMMLVK